MRLNRFKYDLSDRYFLVMLE
jgi:hypothetical protein